MVNNLFVWFYEKMFCFDVNKSQYFGKFLPKN